MRPDVEGGPLKQWQFDHLKTGQHFGSSVIRRPPRTPSTRSDSNALPLLASKNRDYALNPMSG